MKSILQLVRERLINALTGCWLRYDTSSATLPFSPPKRYLVLGMNCVQAQQLLAQFDVCHCYLCKRLDGDCCAALNMETNAVGTQPLRVRSVTLGTGECELVFYVCDECLSLLRGINAPDANNQQPQHH